MTGAVYSFLLFCIPIVCGCQPSSLNGSFSIRDVRTQSGPVSIDKEALGVTLDVKETSENGAEFYDVKLVDLTGKDRAIVLKWTMDSVDEIENWTWLEGLYRSEKVDTSKNYVSENGDFHPLSFNFSAVGSCPNPVARYPFAAITDGERGIGIGIDMNFPAVFRPGFDAKTGELYIEYDLGLAPEMNHASVRFCTFEFDPKWGFRGAMKRFYEIFPDYFTARSLKQGLLQPDQYTSQVEGWKDFGFSATRVWFRDLQFSDQNNLDSFYYIEPMSGWVSLNHDILPQQGNLSNQEYDDSLYNFVLDYFTKDSTYLVQHLYERIESSICYLADNKTPYYGVCDMPWCVGVIFGLNSMPGIEGEYVDFNQKWNEEILANVFDHPEKVGGELEGVYIDSAEGFQMYLDYRREHFSCVQTPLTFDRSTHQPCIFRGCISFEFVREIYQDMRERDKYLMSNQTPSEICFLTQMFDFPGVETDFKKNGKWNPMPLEHMFYRRVLSNQKPYHFLLNTDFSQFNHSDMEKYMKRCTSFAFAPGCFSHNAAEMQYFTRPELYNRDRDLFKKYVPIIQKLSEAGWEILPEATSSDEHINIERFGENYLTVFNDSPIQKTFQLTLENISDASATDLITGQVLTWKDHVATITLSSEDVIVVKFDKILN